VDSATGAKPDLIDFMKSVDTPTLSNAIERLNIRPREQGFMSSEVRCLFPTLGRMCGWAVTAHVETVTQSCARDPERFPELFRTINSSPKPVVVVFQEIGGYREYAAHCGEVMSTLFHRLGAVGLLTDAAVRDLPEVRAFGFHYFARGSVASHANFRIVRVGIPIQVAGVPVKTGDFMHGDENGVLQVPPEVLDRLPEAVETIRSFERTILEHARSPEFDLEYAIRHFFH
jgi:4-hydroxy-4-methyl-2-oxoglutarate aldolase